MENAGRVALISVSLIVLGNAGHVNYIPASIIYIIISYDGHSPQIINTNKLSISNRETRNEVD